MTERNDPLLRDNEELDEILWEIEAEKRDFEAEDDYSDDSSRVRARRNAQKKKSQERNASILKEILDYVVTLAVVVAAVLLLNTYFLINARIPSESMEPTIEKGNQIFGSRLAYLGKDPERFDIIIFRYPDYETQYFIKRVIGLPGETVVIDGGAVYVNGSPDPLDDSYVAEPWGMFEAPMTFEVPEGCYFVMGDNRNHSNDSRYWENHFVAREKILGKAVVRYWPVWQIRTFRYEAPPEE